LHLNRCALTIGDQLRPTWITRACWLIHHIPVKITIPRIKP
jgi:hypothetical protein